MGDAMDIDIDLGDDLGDYEEMAMTTEAPPAPTEAAQEEQTIPEAYRDDFDADIPAKDKIHILGLDSFNPEELKQYLSEHYSESDYRKVEWVNDTSANIIYYHPDHATAALKAFSAVGFSSLPTTEVRPAKQHPSRPEVELFVRQALISDKKVKDARLYSKFYLQNPNYDPEMKERDQGYRRRDYNDSGRGGRRERPQIAPKPFTVDMYDDDPGSNEEEVFEMSRRSSQSSSQFAAQRNRRPSADDFRARNNGRFDDRNARGRFERDESAGDRNDGRFDHRSRNKRLDVEKLLGRGNNGILRDRSRSPLRDGDGRYGFSDDQPRRQTARPRSVSPVPRSDVSRKVSHSNIGRELFPTKSVATPLTSTKQGVELFPGHTPNRSRELFPNKTPHSNHRRSDAMDKGESVSMMSPGARNLADRITGGPKPLSSMNGGSSNGSGGGGFSVKGAATNSDGFSIRGASNEINPKVKELFPQKFGSNAGKELFPSGARGGPRRKAEEML